MDALETLEALSTVKAAKLMLTDHLSTGGGDDPASLFPVAERLMDLFPEELKKPEEALRLLNVDMVRSER